MHTLDLVRFVLGSGFLAYASRLDLRTRRVPNGVWLAFGTLAGLLFLADWFVLERLRWYHVLVVLGLVALCYGLWYVHLLAGGADAKALMAISILLPVAIQWDWGGLRFPLWPSPLPGALTVLSNSVLFFAVAPLVLMVYNASRGHVRLPAMLLGYTMGLERAAASFVWVIDQVDEQGNRRQVWFPSRISDEDYAANIQRLRERGVQRVWVTPKIPFMVPLLLGFVAAFVLGDLLFRAMESIVASLRRS